MARHGYRFRQCCNCKQDHPCAELALSLGEDSVRVAYSTAAEPSIGADWSGEPSTLRFVERPQ